MEMKQLRKLYKWLTSGRYTIGIALFNNKIVNEGFVPEIHWIKDNYKRGWFADPFILRITETEIILLVEEWIYKFNRGVISQVRISREDYSIKEVKTIINTGKHMSFPIYYRQGGKVFIYPEQSEQGETWIYEYDEETCIAKELRLLNPNDVVDTTILELKDNKKVLLCTTAPNHNGEVLDIYPYMDEIFSDVKPIMSIRFPRKTARNAGMPFRVNGKLYRPAQDCTNIYGECVEIQEVLVGKNDISFVPCNRIYSPNIEYNLGFHTFNVFNNYYIAVDAYKRRFITGGILYIVGENIKKLFRIGKKQ